MCMRGTVNAGFDDLFDRGLRRQVKVQLKTLVGQPYDFVDVVNLWVCQDLPVALCQVGGKALQGLWGVLPVPPTDSAKATDKASC